jgi:type I restriction enzyme S subunit
MQLTKPKRGYKQTEVGVIPTDWEVLPVGSKGEVRAGKALAVNGAGRLRPYLRTKNVFDGRIDIDDILEMPMTDAEFAVYSLRCGDVLLNEGQSLELVGRCAIYQDEVPQLCGIQNQLVRFRAFGNTSPHFAAHLFRRSQTSGVFAKIAMQTTSVAHLGVSRFHQLRLAWPPTLAEQEAIATALSDADGLIESLEQLIAKKRQIKHGTMQKLLTGQRRLPGFSGKWETKRLGELGECFSGGTPNTEIAAYYGGDIPWITSSDCNTPRIRSVVGRVTEAGVRNSATKWIKSGTVLIALYGATAGVVAISEINATINQAVLAIEFSSAVSEFMFHKLRMMKECIIATYTQGGQPNLSGAIVKSIEITLPPRPEQSAIATILSDMDAEITALEAKLAKARQVKQGMMQELLTGRIRLV